MKKLIAFAAVAFAVVGCNTAQKNHGADGSAVKDDSPMIVAGAEILSGSYDAGAQAIKLSVKHGGGCGQHEYKLQLDGGCLESSPVQCSMKLVHRTNDFCEALLVRDVTISLADAGLTDRYYEGASIKIKGDRNSSATISLRGASDEPARNEPMALAGAEITGGRYVAAARAIELDVRHGGGCGDHEYKLALAGGCLESMPVQCTLNLEHRTNDGCEALLSRTVRISLQDAGLTDSYYRGARLTIKGARNTSVSVALPRQ